MVDWTAHRQDLVDRLDDVGEEIRERILTTMEDRAYHVPPDTLEARRAIWASVLPGQDDPDPIGLGRFLLAIACDASSGAAVAQNLLELRFGNLWRSDSVFWAQAPAAVRLGFLAGLLEEDCQGFAEVPEDLRRQVTQQRETLLAEGVRPAFMLSDGRAERARIDAEWQRSDPLFRAFIDALGR